MTPRSTAQSTGLIGEGPVGFSQSLTTLEARRATAASAMASSTPFASERQAGSDADAGRAMGAGSAGDHAGASGARGMRVAVAVHDHAIVQLPDAFAAGAAEQKGKERMEQTSRATPHHAHTEAGGRAEVLQVAL